MRIGIGVTTYNRPECLNECLINIARHTNLKSLYINGDVELYVATDTDEDRRGVAYRKNECLRALKDCDYVFLFDDDCFPIKDGWVEWFIKEADGEHVLFLNNKLHNPICKTYNLISYNDCGGVFMFLTKDHIKYIGAFNEDFKIYGFEHCEYSMRCANNHREFLMIEGTEKYLFAHDYSTPNHKSSITDEEKQKCIKNNWDKFFNCEIKDIYLPL